MLWLISSIIDEPWTAFSESTEETSLWDLAIEDKYK